MLTEGFAGRFIQKAQGLVASRLTGLGSVAVAQTEGEGDEATRGGLRYAMSALGATGIAPVQALMSTAAQWMIWNPNGNLVSAFIDVLGMVLISGTAGAGAVLHACPVGPSFAPATVPTTNQAGVTIVNQNPVSQRASKLIVVQSQTLLNAAIGNWQPVAVMNPANTVLGQTIIEARDIRGKMIIPPGCGLALALISPTGTTPLFGPYAQWREYAADVE